MNYLLILLAVSMAVSGLGWIYFIYFFSLGYGFGVSALAVTIAILFKDVITLPTALLCAVMFIFGCRLGLYLLTREKMSPEYKKILYGPDAAKKKPLFVVITVWIFCGLLYVGQVSPVAFFLANKASGAPVNEVLTWVGACMMAVGVLLDLRGSSLDAGELLFVIICGKVQPTDEVIAETCSVMQSLMRCLDFTCNTLILMVADKTV